MEIPGLLKLKLLIADHGPAIVGVLVAVGIVGLAGAGWVYTNPTEATVTERTNPQTVSTSMATSAVVTGNTSMWGEGTRLENRSLYLMSASPNLTVDVRTSVPEGSVDVTQELELVTRAAKEDETFWKASRTLARRNDVVSDGTASMSATMRMREIHDSLSVVGNEISKVGSMHAALVLNVTYDTGTYEGTLTKRAPMTIRPAYYSVDGSLEAQRSHTTPVTRRITRPRTNTTAALLLLGLVSLVSAIGTGVVYRRGIDVEAVKEELHEERHREWISRGTLSAERTGDEVEVEVTTLQDLVDIGIDSNKRVIHDVTSDIYAVLDEDVVYYYGRDGRIETPASDVGVLIVEDKESLADLYAAWLDDSYSVEVAYDREEALETLHPGIDVVLLDRRMPGMSDEEFCEEVRRQNVNCRVAMVTAVEPDFDIVDIDIDSYLTKPVAESDLRETVETLLERKEYDDADEELATLVAKQAALDAEKTDAELEESAEYEVLKNRIQELREQANGDAIDM